MKYLSFDGSATRSEFWGVYLVTWAMGIIALLVYAILAYIGTAGVLLGALGVLIVAIVTIWAAVATSVRRCTDAGINQWFVATLLIPYINIIALIVFGLLPTEKKK